MEKLREELNTLILECGTMNKEVIKTSEKLDKYIVNYYKNKLRSNCVQAL